MIDKDDIRRHLAKYIPGENPDIPDRYVYAYETFCRFWHGWKSGDPPYEVTVLFAWLLDHLDLPERPDPKPKTRAKAGAK